MAARLTTYLVVAIVSATVIAGLIVGAQRDDSDGPVDLIVHNARVFTADEDGTVAEAVAIRGNQILRAGDEREVLRLQRPQTTMIDAGGATVLPGFNDSHAHLIAGGLSLDLIDLTGAASADEVRTRIKAGVDANPDGAWIQGRGWNPKSFAGVLPTRQFLDAVISKRPAMFTSHDGELAWVSTAALKAARITRATPDPRHGTIGRDSRTGEPTGILTGAAVDLVRRAMPQVTREARAQALQDAISEAHRHGVTSVHDPDVTADELEAYAEARRAGDLELRVYAAVRAASPFDDGERTRLSNIFGRYPDDPLLKTGGVKIRVDGAVTARTAAMLAPDTAGSPAGEPLIAPDDLNRLVRLIDAEGWQILAHASGDRAVRMTLDAYQHAIRSNGGAARTRRHRIEHADAVDPLDLPRLATMGIIASIQPPRALPFVEGLEPLPSDAAGGPRAGAFRSLGGADGRLAFGSNWPASSLDPMLGLQVAVNRTGSGGPAEGGSHALERVSLEAALRAYTSVAAWASFDEQRKGTIAPGMLADLVVLSDDILEGSRTSLASTRVRYTIFDGKIVYSADRGTR